MFLIVASIATADERTRKLAERLPEEAALFARERTGQGQRVDASIYGTMIAMQGFELNYSSMTGQEPQRAAAELRRLFV